MTQHRSFWPLVLFIIALVFYWQTLAPTVLWGDDAYFQQAAFVGNTAFRPDGSAHWLWLKAAQQFIRLPWGNIAYRVNLLSAVAASITIVGIYAAARTLQLSVVAAIIAATSLAISHTFWSQAVRAEVYTLFTALMSFQLALWFYWQKNRPWPIYTAALLYGITIIGHQMALLLWPGAMLLLWTRRHWLTPKQWLLLLLTFMIGLILFLGVIYTQIGQVANLSMIISLQRYFTQSGDDYRQAMLDFSSQTLLRDIILWLGFLGFQFFSPALFLGIWGSVKSIRNYKQSNWLVLIILYLTMILFAFSYHVNDQFVFYLPSYLIFSLLIGRGWDEITQIWPHITNLKTVSMIIAFILIMPTATYYLSGSFLDSQNINPFGIRQFAYA